VLFKRCVSFFSKKHLFYNIALEVDPNYVKVLLRRAQAREKLATLESLTGALEG